jgi:hypothetical protein
MTQSSSNMGPLVEPGGRKSAALTVQQSCLPLSVGAHIARRHVQKTYLERFSNIIPFRYDLPCIFSASDKRFQPLLAACQKTSVFRDRTRSLIQAVEKQQPFGFAKKPKLPRSPYVCLCVSAGLFIT